MISSSGRGKWDSAIDLLCYLCLPIVSLHFLIENPYGGVEERFIMNTAYDFAYNTPHEEFHHIKRPHVVPRTIIPSLILAAVAKPFIWLGLDDITIQIILRGVVGLQGVFGYYSLAQAIGKEYGNNVKRGFLLLCAVQYKLVYNISRTYPNIIAQNILLYMWVFLIRGDHLNAIKVICYVAVILRSEVALFLFPLCLGYLLFYKGSVYKLLRTGIIHCFIALFITVVPDSIFWKHWGRVVWPELTAFVFNVIDGNSAYWGEREFLYYLIRLPHMLGINEILMWVLLALGLFKHINRMIYPAIICSFYILIYSFLPHKEERFITYTIPIGNLLIVLAVGSILQADFLFKKNKAVLFILKTSIPLVLLYMFVDSERELQHRAGDFLGGAATLQLSNYEYKENVTILMKTSCSLFGASLFTLPLHNPKLNITMLEDSISHHIKEDSWVYKFFGDNCKYCSDNKTIDHYDDYDMFLTSIEEIPPEKPSNTTTDTWTLLDTISVDTVPTLNHFSWIHSNIPRRNVTLSVFIYIKDKSLHKIAKK